MAQFQYSQIILNSSEPCSYTRKLFTFLIINCSHNHTDQVLSKIKGLNYAWSCALPIFQLQQQGTTPSLGIIWLPYMMRSNHKRICCFPRFTSKQHMLKDLCCLHIFQADYQLLVPYISLYSQTPLYTLLFKIKLILDLLKMKLPYIYMYIYI